MIFIFPVAAYLNKSAIRNTYAVACKQVYLDSNNEATIISAHWSDKSENKQQVSCCVCRVTYNMRAFLYLWLAANSCRAVTLNEFCNFFQSTHRLATIRCSSQKCNLKSVDEFSKPVNKSVILLILFNWLYFPSLYFSSIKNYTLLEMNSTTYL